MEQDNKLAELVKELLNKKQLNYDPPDYNKPIVSQAREFIDDDTRNLVRFGKKFQIPKEENLEPHLKVVFNDFLVEPLLQEGSLLLDRCLQQRREYEELKTKWFEATILVDEFFRLNDITEREENENYDIPKEIAQIEQDVLNEEKKQISDSYATNINYSSAEWADARDAEIANAQAKTVKSPDDQQIISAFKEIESLRRRREKFHLFMDRIELQSQNVSHTSKIKGSRNNVKLRESLAKFQRERNDVSRLVGLRRALQLIQTSGALNFGEQMQPISDRLKNDLIGAYYRLFAASIGLSSLYQYPNNFPKLSENREIDFDELVTWCQYTNTWLASFLDKQQQVTRSFSLKQILSEQNRNFTDGLAMGKWQFKLKEEHFYNSKFVRLRGLAIQIDSGHFSGNWNIAVAPPLLAVMRSDEPEVQKLNQPKIGTLYLGRVNETTFQVIPESVAPPKLYNASPIGQDTPDGSGEWKIEILGMSTDDKPASSINDIDIHMTVSLV